MPSKVLILIPAGIIMKLTGHRKLSDGRWMGMWYGHSPRSPLGMPPASDTSTPRLRLACSYHSGQLVERVTPRAPSIGLGAKSIGILRILKILAITRHRLLISQCILSILPLGPVMDIGHMFMSIKMDLKARFALRITTPFFQTWAILV